MAIDPPIPQTPAQKQAQQDRVELLRQQAKANSEVSTSLAAVEKAMGLVDEQTEGLSKRTQELNEKNKDRIKLLEKQTKLQALGNDLTDAEGLKLHLLTQETEEFAKKLKIANDARREEIDLQKEFLDIGKQVTGLQLDQLGTVKGLTTAFISFAHQLDSANVKLAQSSGYTTALQGDMNGLVSSTHGLGIGVAQAGEIVGGLNAQFSLFITENESTRESLAQTTAMLSKMGVAAAESGQALDSLTRGMGFSTQAAEVALKGFDKLSQEIGLPTSQMVKDFNTLAPQLSRYGKQAPKVFQNLAKEARKLGVSVKAAFDITEKFDTFEGAADLAGKMNAQLGLQLNSVQLMTASHEDRLKIMRQEFQTRGKNFKDMSVRQKQAIAEVMGVDVDMASRLFGDPVELRKYQKEQKTLAERSEKMTTAMDQFKVALEEMFIVLAPIVNAFLGFVRLLSKLWIPQIIMAAWAVKGLWMAIGPFKAIFTTLIPKFAAWAVSIFAVGRSSETTAPSVGLLGTVSQLTGKQMMALGVAVLAVGVGLGIAFFGASYLVEAFKGMGAEAIAAVAGILAFGGALYFAAPAITAAGAAGWVAAIPILALGAAMLMAGVGVGFMAQGLAMLVEGFAELAPHFLPLAILSGPLALGLLAVAASVAVLGIAMLAVINPLTLWGLNVFTKSMVVLGAAFNVTTAAAEPAAKALKNAFKSISSSLTEFTGLTPAIWDSATALGTFALVLGAIAFSFLNPLLLLGLAAFTASLYGIAGALALISLSTDALASLEKIITVSTNVDTTELDNLKTVMGEVRHTMIASTSADKAAMANLASATQNMSSPQLASKIPIKLIVNDRVFGETVVDFYDKGTAATSVS